MRVSGSSARTASSTAEACRSATAASRRLRPVSARLTATHCSSGGVANRSICGCQRTFSLRAGRASGAPGAAPPPACRPAAPPARRSCGWPARARSRAGRRCRRRTRPPRHACSARGGASRGTRSARSSGWRTARRRGCGRAGGWRSRRPAPAVEGRGAAADLVHQHQRVLGGAVQDGGGLGHLMKKVDWALARSSAAPMRCGSRRSAPAGSAGRARNRSPPAAPSAPPGA